MLYIVSIGLFMFNIVKKNSKVLYVLLFVFLWLLFGWSSGNADSGVYISRFDNYNSLANETEKLFTKLLELVHEIGGTYQTFLIIVATVGLAIIAYIIYKYSENFTFVAALYFLFPFVMDVTQIRNYTAFVIVIYGFKYLISNDKNSDLKYLICIAVAANFHFSTIVFAIMLVPKHFSIQKTIFVTVICIIVLFLVPSMFIAIQKYSGVLFNSIKVEKVLDVATNRYTINTIYKTWFRVIVFFCSFLIMYYFILKPRLIYLKEIELKKVRIGLEERKKIIELVAKMNIVMLMILPLITISVDFYRLQQALSIFNYIAFSQYFIPIKRNVMTKGNILVSTLCIIIAFINLYLLVLNNSNYNTVFRPVFENNLLFN